MKKIISLVVLLLVIGLSVPVLFSSDAKVILRALYQSDEVNLETIMMPSWIADIKLRVLGINECNLSFTEQNDTGSVINFLVSAYGGEGVDNARVEMYITQFVKQGCSINDYDIAGMTPLHAAVLFNQPKLVTLLLENKADVTKKINRSGKRVDGMQPLKFAKYLLTSNNSPELKEIIALLQNKNN